ncbi:DNA breaking-rejoining enzyme, partial [Punctularia strigosozonata HHB-11173 SS5]|uniref:DNA breaking-rejoining enzyme n=1 Tax=Punctularia strigosozonata (strain HHB-11173) TaxID=741275 RepID=UPI0004417FDA
RPNVQAHERLRYWSTSYTQERERDVVDRLGLDIATAAKDAAIEGWTKKTREVYAAGPLRFTQFCQEKGVPEALWMPADPFLIAAFIAHFQGSVGGSCIKSWLSGLKAWHDIHGAPWHGGSALVKLSRVGASRAGASHTKPPRSPITIAHLRALEQGLTLTNPKDAAIWAVATNAFWGCRRLGELTVPSLGGFEGRFHVQHGTRMDWRRVAAADSVSYRIPWTKTTKDGGASVTLNEQDVACPLQALSTHLAVNGGAGPTEHLFAYRDPSGLFKPMVKSVFLARCNEIWAGAELEEVQGHGFRIGGTTELLLAGVAPEAVQKLGSWSSSAFLAYWRRVEIIVASNIAQAYSRERIEVVRNSIEDFRTRHGLAQARTTTQE